MFLFSTTKTMSTRILKRRIEPLATTIMLSLRRTVTIAHVESTMIQTFGRSAAAKDLRIKMIRTEGGHKQ